ncbi:hypothetical protein niasHS_018202 [Heterodera schachtii]|uniref:Uncharacterized protein n=1 Tax=Heterodera schachtii TaxID=97005 RepID=A0ABD2HSL6_HETSC
MSKDNKNVNVVDILGLDDTDADATVDLEYHDRLVQASKNFKSENQYKELLRLRFKLVASGVLKPKRSLDGLQIPPPILEKIGELFDCLDWALSADDE